MSFYIKLITEFSEASTYDLLALYKNLCVCVAALEHFLLLFFSPIETWYPWTVSPVSTNKQWGLQPWNVASWLAKPARAFTSWSVMSFYPVSWCFQKQAEINTGTLLPMWFNPSLGSQWKNVETVLKWKGSTRKQYQKKKEKKKKKARITVVFHVKSIQYIVILSFYRNSTLSEKASQHSSTVLPVPSQWIFSGVKYDTIWSNSAPSQTCP